MDKIREFVANIISGDNVAAKNNFNEMAYDIALEKLGERKLEIAQNLFQTEETQSLEEGPIGAAIGGGLGAMAGGPLGAALGGALGHAAGEVAPGILKKVGKVAKKVVGIGGGAVVGGALGGPLGALGGGYLGHRMTKEEAELDEASYSAKEARAGKDIGKPGKQFAKIAKSAAERYGSMERGKKVAGAVLANLRKEEAESLDEKAVSQQQQKFMGAVYATKKGAKPASPEIAKAAAGMTTKQARDYAATKHAGLPKKVNQEGWFGGSDKPTPPPKQEPSTPPPTTSSQPSSSGGGVGGAIGAIKSRQKMLDDI